MASRKWKPSVTGPVARHYEDDALRTEIAALLARLPADHVARLAFDTGAPTLDVQRLVDDIVLVDAIGKAYGRWRDRLALIPPGHFNPYR